MTVINPNKNKRKIFPPAISALISVIIILGGVYVFEYNRLVDLEYDIPQAKEKVQSVTAENSDLRKNIYDITSPDRLKSIAQQNNLVVEEKPSYFNLENPLAQLR